MQKDQFIYQLNNEILIEIGLFLGFEDYILGLGQMCLKIKQQIDCNDSIWKKFFIQEFLFQDYVDHQKQQQESYLSYFKRSFLKYKRFRYMMKKINFLSNKMTDTEQQLTKPFSQRNVHQIIKDLPVVTFQLECFYKNFLEINNCQQNLEEIVDRLFQNNSCPSGIYQHLEYIDNFLLTRTEFYSETMNLIFLSPISVKITRGLIKQLFKKDLIPFLHTLGYLHQVYVDVTNSAGFGHNALISVRNYVDNQQHSLIISRSIEEFLQDHMTKLKENWFYVKEGTIQSFARCPQDQYGSVTVTQGVKIEAVGQYIHLLSNSQQFMFAYQIRIVATDDLLEKCQLVSRYWRIVNNDKIEEVQGPGVIGKYPKIEKGKPMFVYESQCPVSNFTTYMEGHFLFKYLDGEIKGQQFKAIIDPFQFKLSGWINQSNQTIEGDQLIQTPDYFINV